MPDLETQFCETSLPDMAGQAQRAGAHKRVFKHIDDALPDHDVLALILSRVIARKNVRPLVRKLLARFGDFNQVVTAEPDRLAEISGVTEDLIEELGLIQAAACRLAQARIIQADALSSWDALLDYCTIRMGHLKTEELRILFLNQKNVLIADEAHARGTVNHVPVYPREILKRALALNASALIVVHNHPSGDSAPSEGDIAMTRILRTGAEALGLVLHDHLIIAGGGSYSFREAGHL
ncbi:MAG: DNA repair protein RadC [Paracoccaceae bacterium]